MIRIEKINSWNKKFFKQFVSFKNRLYSSDPYYLRESLNDLKKLYASYSPFNQALEWQAILVFDSNCVVGRVMFFYNKTRQICYFGYFEVIPQYEVAKTIFNEVVILAKEYGVVELKGPIDGNFYNSYRLKDTGEQGKRFYNEPIGKDYYSQFLEQYGFSVFKKWITTENDFFQSEKTRKIMSYMKQRNPALGEVTIRHARVKQWDHELGLFYKMFMDSFSSMSEFEVISLDLFRYLYNDLRYIVDPKATLIAEHKGKAIGFSVAFFDPLPVFLFLQKLFFVPSIIKKALGVILLKRKAGNMLVLYVGKISENGYNGIQTLLHERVFAHCRSVAAKKILGCYIADDSKIKNDGSTPYSSYSLYIYKWA